MNPVVPVAPIRSVGAAGWSSSPSKGGYGIFDSDSDEDADTLVARMAKAAVGGRAELLPQDSLLSEELYVAPEFREQGWKVHGLAALGTSSTGRPTPRRRDAWSEWSFLSAEHDVINTQKAKRVAAATVAATAAAAVADAALEASTAQLRAAEAEAEAEAADMEAWQLLLPRFVGGGRRVQTGGLEPVVSSEVAEGQVAREAADIAASRQHFFELAGPSHLTNTSDVGECATSFERTIKKHSAMDYKETCRRGHIVLRALTGEGPRQSICDRDPMAPEDMLSLEARHLLSDGVLEKERSKPVKKTKIVKGNLRQVGSMPKSTPLGGRASMPARGLTGGGQSSSFKLGTCLGFDQDQEELVDSFAYRRASARSAKPPAAAAAARAAPVTVPMGTEHGMPTLAELMAALDKQDVD